MKRMKLLISLALLMVIGFWACSSDDDPVPTDNSIITSGGWVVHLYTDDNIDETAHYTGYTFVFANGGNLTVSKTGVSVTGTWGIRMDDGKKKLDITLVTSDADLLELNNDWVVKTLTSSLIELEDDNVASGEVLHFQKK
ncbi:hypothetical protein [Flavihumibacter sp.]|uniref:hypothetical protein n=1 Tax=Flavihumibacter sp. TaxID=1913981 RepID=UPI002FC8F95D|nr:hypothetical protein [Flavihumibacter sediminis]